MTERVEIILPTGEEATVPRADLAQAVAAGARQPTEEELTQREGGGLGTQLATGAVAAGRVASFGLSDALLAEGANVIGGEGLRRDMLQSLQLGRETNKYSDMIGEGAGLFVGGLGTAGEAVEGAVASRLGEGLLGRTAAMGARGFVEGATLGAQHQITEDTLGDHEYNGQAIFANAAKEGLLGGGLGAGLGAATHGLLRHMSGPTSHAVLDEVAGVEGAGRLIQRDAKATESLVGDLQRTGATSEQAARMADEVNTLSRTRAEAGPLSGVLDGVTDAYAANRAAGNSDMASVLAKGYQERATRIAERSALFDTHARAMAEKGTSAMRFLEDTVNEVHFSERPSQIAKLVDGTKYTAARDMSVRLAQEVQGVVDLLESTATKGGGDVAIKRIGRELKDFASKTSKLPVDAVESATATRDAFMNAYKLKQAVGKYAGFGKPEFMRTAAENEFAGVYERLRVGLEDESVWGPAGAATREWNESFSMAKGRRDDFGRRFSVSVDQVNGVITPEVDAGKVKGMLRQLGGAESDQAVKTTESFVDGLRNRVNAIEKYGDMSAAQRSRLQLGKKALAEFEETFGKARKESEILAKLEEQQLQEQNKGIGGVLGLVSDLVTRPLTTVERLAQIRQTTRTVEKAVAGGLERFFKTTGKEVVEAAAPRAKADIVKEIGEIRSVAGNPIALQERVSKMVGDLGKYAPRTAEEVKATATRALYYLAKEAPPASVPLSLMGYHRALPRYSDQQVAAWEAKRQAVLGDGKKTPPEVLIGDMRRGKLNRDAIKAIEFVSPKLFASLQDTARAELERMEAMGLLDRMPYQQKAALSTLLKVPADGTWRPDFIGLMQAAKAAPPPEPQPAPGAPVNGTSKRAIKLDTNIFATEAAAIEQGMVA